MTDTLKLFTPVAASSPASSMADVLTRALSRIALMIKSRHEKRKISRLLRLDHQVLVDIGIDPHDAEDLLHHSCSADVIGKLQRMRQQRSSTLIGRV
jgi:uncharacterized protein YjiS (DUF1127 family)